MEEQNWICDAETACNHHATEIHIFNGLPRLAALNVLNFLDPGTLRSLRGVCNFTKCLIDSTPSVMKQLRVYIQDEFRMEEIIKSEINWSNIQIPSDLCNIKLVPFLGRFRLSITKIKIVNDKENINPDSLNPIDLINILLELNGGFLDTLCIRADLAPKRAPGARSHLLGTEEFDINTLKTLLEDSNQILRRNLRRLRRLEFREMSSSSLIMDLLSNCFYDVCRNLVHIRLPRYLLSWDGSRMEDKCSPLTFYLERIVGSPRKYELITIDFGSVGFGSDWDDRGFYGYSSYPMTSGRFTKLLKYFEKENLRVRLLNVERFALPENENSSDVEKMLNRYVRSIHLTDIKEGLAPVMYIPFLKCQVKILLNILSGTAVPHSAMEKLWTTTALNITSVRVHEFSPDILDGFFDLFLRGALCPTVVSLMISKTHCTENLDSPLKTILSMMFPNVRKLYLSRCPRLDCYSDTSPLNGFNQLEDLTLKNCGLAKNHFIRRSARTHPLFLKFKKLRRLRLLS